MADPKLLNKIRGLLDKAGSTEFPNEREALLGKAQELMDRHDIEEAQLELEGRGETRKPIKREIDLGDWTFSAQKIDLFYAFAKHARVRCAIEFRERHYFATVVGLENGISFAEMLYTVAVMEFITKINPGWRKEVTFDANVKALKESGRKWVDIAFEANRNGGNPRTGKPGSVTDGAWLKTAYRRECDRLGEPVVRHTQRHEAYRTSFASSFVTTIQTELWKMRRDAEKATGVNVGNLPVIRSIDERVDEEFYRLFPDMHPDAYRAQSAKARAEYDAMLDAMTPEERAAYDRDQAKSDEKSKKYYERNRHARYDANGWNAGEQAARAVDLSGGKGNVNRHERVELS